MKFGKIGPLGPIGKVMLVSAVALFVATLFTACGTLNVGFLFVATNKQSPGQIEVYEVDSESGSVRTIPTSPFPSGGRNPIAEAAASDSKNLYVVNEDDNNVVQFGIGTDGKLYPQSTVNTPGSFPVALALNTAHTNLYVVDTLQPIAGCSRSNPCPGDVAFCPINADGSLGTPVDGTNRCLDYYPLELTFSKKTVLTPTAITVLANGQFVYVTAYNANSSPQTGYIFGFTVGSDGTLTSVDLSGSAGLGALQVGSQPVALTADSTGAFLYLLDKSKNLVTSYAVGTNGSLRFAGSTSTGNQPSSFTLSNDAYMYVANSGDSNVTGYTVGESGGTVNFSRFGSYASDVDPVAITVDPRKVGFLYTVNFLGATLSGYQINAKDGTLINTKRSPYPSTVQPTAIAGIPHGGTATSASK